MKADVSDVDELLEMIRSTALTDYIRFDLNRKRKALPRYLITLDVLTVFT